MQYSRSLTQAGSDDWFFYAKALGQLRTVLIYGGLSVNKMKSMQNHNLWETVKYQLIL